MNLFFNGPQSIFNLDPTLTGVIKDSSQPIVPSYATTVDIVPRINSVKFGDGYEQRSKDGLNVVPKIWDVTFQNRSLTVVTALKKFFEGDTYVYNREPQEYFWWEPPEPWNLMEKYVCDKFTVSYNEYNSYTLRATLRQVFDASALNFYKSVLV
jgi:phage-related protein